MAPQVGFEPGTLWLTADVFRKARLRGMRELRESLACGFNYLLVVVRDTGPKQVMFKVGTTWQDY